MDSPFTDTTPTPGATQRPRHEYWCHQCAVEITPLMVPDPLCPQCHSEFVEKIEEDNDPRNFVEPAGEGGVGSGEDEGHEAHEAVTMEDILRLFQIISGPPRAPQLQRQQRQPPHVEQPGQRRQQNHLPGEYPTEDDSNLRRTGYHSPTAAMTGTRAGTGTQPRPGHPRGNSSNSMTTRASAPRELDEDVEMTDASLEDEDQYEDDHEVHRHPITDPLAALMQRIGMEFQYVSQGGTQGEHGGGAGGGLGSFFNMVGNPGDYVFSQSALDDVITQMMEMQGRHSGPVGASDEVIESIPPHILTDEELEAKTECSVCKDEFTKEEEQLLQLKCKHIFHGDCIKPWLKMNGTCPTCRFALVPQHELEEEEEHPNQTSTQREQQVDGDSWRRSRGLERRAGSRSEGTTAAANGSGSRTARRATSPSSNLLSRSLFRRPSRPDTPLPDDLD